MLRCYREERLHENPILEPRGAGWYSRAMHHLDVIPWEGGTYLGVFDGQGVLKMRDS